MITPYKESALDNPFRRIASDYPYTEVIELCDDDKLLLVIGMIARIKDLISWGVSYNASAARQMIYLDADYGLVYAAALWQGISTLKGVKLGPEFFQFQEDNIRSVNEVISDIVSIVSDLDEDGEEEFRTSLSLTSDEDY